MLGGVEPKAGTVSKRANTRAETSHLCYWERRGTLLCPLVCVCSINSSWKSTNSNWCSINSRILSDAPPSPLILTPYLTRLQWRKSYWQISQLIFKWEVFNKRWKRTEACTRAVSDATFIMPAARYLAQLLLLKEPDKVCLCLGRNYTGVALEVWFIALRT